MDHCSLWNVLWEQIPRGAPCPTCTVLCWLEFSTPRPCPQPSGQACSSRPPNAAGIPGPQVPLQTQPVCVAPQMAPCWSGPAPAAAHTGMARALPFVCLEMTAVWTHMGHGNHTRSASFFVFFFFSPRYNNFSRCSAFKEYTFHFHNFGFLFKGTVVKLRS